MRRITGDKTIAVTANNEAVNYPASRLLEDPPSRLWRVEAGGSQAILTVDVASGWTDLMLFNTNAETASGSIVDPNFAEWGDDDEWGHVVSGSELATNREYDNWTGDDPDDWTVSNEDGSNYITEHANGARIVSNNTSVILMGQHILTIGTAYEVICTKSNHVSGNIRMVLGELGVVNLPSSDANGTFSETFVADDTEIVILRDVSGNTDYVLNSISVKEINQDTWANDTESLESIPATSVSGKALHIQLSSAVEKSSQVTLILSGNSTLYGGRIIAGVAKTYGDHEPIYGLNYSRLDRSIKNDYPRYYSKRETPRAYAVNMQMTYDNAHDFDVDFDVYGEVSHGWKIVSSKGGEFLLYGYCANISVSYDYPSHAWVGFNLVEVK